MDVYQCAIYLDRESTNSELTLKLKHFVAVRIKILISELPDQVPDAWREAIKPEISHKLYSRFVKQICYINNEIKFSNPGSGLMQALLEQWLELHPVSEDLKAALIIE